VVKLHQIERSWWLVIVADVAALLTFAAAAVVAVRDGVNSGALIIGIPPLAVAVMASVAIGAASYWRLRWPLGVTIAMCTLATLVAMVSFITPLLAVTVPVCALLIGASANRLISDVTARAPD
jgi:hypothetical protein